MTAWADGERIFSVLFVVSFRDEKRVSKRKRKRDPRFQRMEEEIDGKENDRWWDVENR